MNQPEKKRNVKSNGAPATKPIRNQGKPPHGDKSAVSNSVGREHSRDDRDNKPNVQGVYLNARFVHACAALVGHVVQVRLRNDSEIYVGVFHTISPNLEIALQSVHAISKSAVNSTSALVSQAPDHLASLLYEMDTIRAEPLKDAVIFSLQDVVSMTASNIDLDFATKDHAFTDSQISGANGHVQERDLQKWVADDEDGKEFVDLEKSAGISSWNPEKMFEVNAKKFAVKSTFKQNLEGYTYQIEHEDTAEYHERDALATKLAHEIENNPLNKRRMELEVGGDGEDEERKFSAVVKDGINRGDGRQDRYNHNNNRRNKTLPANGGLKGPQRGMGGNSHHSQRSAHNRSPPMQAPHQTNQQAQNRKDDRGDSMRKGGERSPANRVTPSPKPNDKRDSPVMTGQHSSRSSPPSQPPPAHHSPPPVRQMSPTENRKKTPSPPAQEEFHGKQSPRESPSSPAPAKAPSPATLSAVEATSELVKKSTLNPNAEEFVFTPKIQEVTHNKNQQINMHVQQFPHGGQRGPHIMAQNGILNMHGGPGFMMPTNQHAFQNPGHHHMHPGNPHQRMYRPPKGGNRQTEAMQVAGSPLLTAPPQHPNILVQYPSSSSPFAAGGPGVQTNVVMQQPLQAQQMQVLPVSTMMQPRAVISPPAGACPNVFQQMFLDPTLQFGQGSQMVFRSDLQSHMFQPYDPANVILVSSQQAPNQSGNPAQPGANGPHGHPNQQQLGYAGQASWVPNLMMMNTLNNPGTPPPHHQMHHISMLPPAVHPGHQVHSGSHGHGPHGHGPYAPTVVSAQGAIQVPAPVGGVPSPSGANPNATALSQQQATQGNQQSQPTGQVPPSGQQAGPQQPPSQTQQP